MMIDKLNILFIVNHIDFIDPQGIMQLSAIAKKKGHSTYLGILTRENVLDKIKKLKPDILCYSASTGEHKFYFEFQKLVNKHFNIVSILGGAHPTFFPEDFNKSNMSAFCRAEGDNFFNEFLDCIANGRDFSSLDNIVTEKGINKLRPLIEDLDSLPFPDRDIFYKNTEMSWFPVKSFMFSRGCPYPCTYCFNHSYRKLYNFQMKPVRRTSVEYAIEQILSVKAKYPIHLIKFYDDIFTFPNDVWLEKFCKEYQARVKIPFHCASRCDILNEDIIKLLKIAGCYSINMSIESGTPHLRNDLLKRNMTDEQIKNAFRLCEKYNIKTFCNSILGLPYSSIKDDKQTIDLNVECKVTFAEFPVLYPYPKTELGEYCKEKGYFEGDYTKLHFSYQTRSPLSCFTEKQKDIQQNLSLLGTVIVWQPWLKSICYKFLIYLPVNKLFFYAYLLTKIYLIKTKIYPHKLTLRQIFYLLKKSIFVDKAKHFEE
ncbi:MAG: radical SAM protein [Candidatus Hydrogenedentota bacterium]